MTLNHCLEDFGVEGYCNFSDFSELIIDNLLPKCCRWSKVAKLFIFYTSWMTRNLVPEDPSLLFLSPRIAGGHLRKSCGMHKPMNCQCYSKEKTIASFKIVNEKLLLPVYPDYCISLGKRNEFFRIYFGSILGANYESWICGFNVLSIQGTQSTSGNESEAQ